MDFHGPGWCVKQDIDFVCVAKNFEAKKLFFSNNFFFVMSKRDKLETTCIALVPASDVSVSVDVMEEFKKILFVELVLVVC